MKTFVHICLFVVLFVCFSTGTLLLEHLMLTADIYVCYREHVSMTDSRYSVGGPNNL